MEAEDGCRVWAAALEVGEVRAGRRDAPTRPGTGLWLRAVLRVLGEVPLGGRRYCHWLVISTSDRLGSCTCEDERSTRMGCGGAVVSAAWGLGATTAGLDLPWDERADGDWGAVVARTIGASPGEVLAGAGLHWPLREGCLGGAAAEHGPCLRSCTHRQSHRPLGQ